VSYYLLAIVLSVLVWPLKPSGPSDPTDPSDYIFIVVVGVLPFFAWPSLVIAWQFWRQRRRSNARVAAYQKMMGEIDCELALIRRSLERAAGRPAFHRRIWFGILIAVGLLLPFGPPVLEINKILEVPTAYKVVAIALSVLCL